jgi:hypothetical protein
VTNHSQVFPRLLIVFDFLRKFMRIIIMLSTTLHS